MLQQIADLHDKVAVPEPTILAISMGEIRTAWDNMPDAKQKFPNADRFADWFDGLSLAERTKYDANIFFPLQIQLQIQKIDRFRSYVYKWERSKLTINFPEGYAPERAASRGALCVRRVRAMQQAFSDSHKLEIALWHLDAPKILGDPLRINSGYTEFTSHVRRKIVIYRREELLKVLTHEMIHAIGLDGNHNDASHSRKLASRFSLCDRANTTMTRPEEAYTDAWAIIINAMLRGTPIEDEQRHCARQCASLLVWFGFRDMEDLERNRNSCLPQNTSLLSYYVLKSALLSNLKTFTTSFPSLRIDSDTFSRVTEEGLNNLTWRRDIRVTAAGLSRDRIRGQSMRMSVTLS